MKKKILCYLRPFTKEQFGYFIKCAVPNQIIVYCSEHRSVDQTGLPKLYYSFLRNKKLNLNETKLSKSEANDMILRCRLLRAINKKLALNHLIAMYLAVNEIINIEKPNYVVMQTVDSYITDLIRFISIRKKIKFIGIIATPINNHFRVTARGEMTINKKANRKLTKIFLPKLIKDSYTPKFNEKSLMNPKRGILIRWLKNFIGLFYFFIKRYLSKDIYNYHFWHSQIRCQKHFMLFPPRDIGDTRWEDKLDNKQKPSIYIPLQMYPETTVDYASQDLEVVDYYNTLEKFIGKLHKNFSLFIKEHPNIMGARPKKFYQKIKSDKRVTVIPTYTNSNYITKKTDSAMVWTGTVGLDSMIRSKAVFGLATPYYASGKRFLKINKNTSIKKMLRHILFCKKFPISKAEQEKTFNYLARQLYKGNYKAHFDWSEKNSKDIKDVKQMANSTKHLFN